MDAVSEIQRDRTRGQLDYLSFGCENKHQIGEKIHLQRLHKLRCVSGLLLKLQNIGEHVHFIAGPEVCRYRLGAVFLIGPVGRDAEFRRFVHFPGADLHLQRFAAGSDHSGVQGLVHVGLGHGDIILKPARHRLV
ncbi:hypothetical protein D3C76_1201290 [compost metagenome]